MIGGRSDLRVVLVTGPIDFRAEDKQTGIFGRE
jgi:hypothetical protein